MERSHSPGYFDPGDARNLGQAGEVDTIDPPSDHTHRSQDVVDLEPGPPEAGQEIVGRLAHLDDDFDVAWFAAGHRSYVTRPLDHATGMWASPVPTSTAGDSNASASIRRRATRPAPVTPSLPWIAAATPATCGVAIDVPE